MSSSSPVWSNASAVTARKHLPDIVGHGPAASGNYSNTERRRYAMFPGSSGPQSKTPPTILDAHYPPMTCYDEMVSNWAG
jgi:hypothetical protein